MDTLESLKHDHQEIRELLEQAESTKDGAKQKDLFKQAIKALEIHARNEEAIFHASLKAQPKDIFLESYDEDEQMKTLLREIEYLVFKLNVLKNDVEQHADNEEGESVPHVSNLDATARKSKPEFKSQSEGVSELVKMKLQAERFLTMGFYIIVLTTLCLSWSYVRAEDYKYPYHDPYVATATTAILNDDGLTPRPKSQIVHVPGLPGRNQLRSLEGRGQTSISLYRQNHAAPLLFILPGIGSNPYFGVATYLANLFYQEGFHIVILPSPMSWNFALSASRSGAPGYAPADARDLYEVMQKSLPLLRDRYNVRTTAINFMGVSLGALEGAYVSVIDSDERKIGIEKYLLVNPPLDLAYALKKVDAWHALQDKFGSDQAKGIVAKAVTIVESFSKDRRDDPAVFDRFAKDFASFSREEIQFLIAEDLQTLLPELVYVTQAIHEQSVLAAAKVRKRLQEAKDLTFMDYNEKIALPLWRLQAAEPEANLETFIERGSLASILDQLSSNPKVHIMHNADDFFTDKKSIEGLKEALGEQVTLYPHGGHLGNLWYSENKQDAISLFTARRLPPQIQAQRLP